MTRLETLEIENQVLRYSIEMVKRARDRLNTSPRDGTAVVRCLGSLDSAVNFEGCLERELRRAAARKSKTPGEGAPGES